ncbi:DUF5131 family protein [Desulfoscipio gibsoniae]|uniref:Bacteriophage protein gp37 n=1 Tax=Desulfoscipio gibsoniae DSM 7213 TaxID=767817 RepID=R4KLL3_9FIRM|nr:phage Gp37/Gp68 family protein [Desulfoscipio gibsoniae]AGL02462.1 bacteriophage protein gp37 [Desulfoscipio gibsoniae DSM 7213]
MAVNSKIEWTEATWNPVTGCSKISQGCKNCYAERLAKRLHAMGNPRYKNGFNVTLHRDLVSLPLKWKKPRMIFVNSMSDLFHEEIPFEFIKAVFNTMVNADHHIFQVLTKRNKRMIELAPMLPWPNNIWMGVTVENQAVINRIHDLRQTPAKIKFISAEPLLSDLPDFPCKGVDWVIAGGESGPGARPMHPDWARSLRDQCQDAGVPFFFKQWGGFNKKAAGRILDGQTWNQLPNRYNEISLF